MPSQFFGLTIGYSGLLSANAALNTTGNNIANVETNGYSRQQVVQEAANALRVFADYGCAGAGVEVLAIERIRDEFYDVKYWNNSTNLGEYSIKSYYMKQVEDYFTDDSTIEGFKTIFDQMMNALAEVAKNSGNNSTKAQFIGSASSLCDYFNTTATNLEQVQKDVNQEIKLKIDEINTIAEEIATLNKQINVIEIDGKSNANELRDKRALLLDQLSAIVDIEVKETPITDTNNPDRYTGAHRLIVKIAGGQTLVDGNDYHTLECVARKEEEKVNQSDIDGLYDVYWVSNRLTGELGDQFNLYNAAMGGELQGLIQMRDGNNGENFQGTVTDIKTLPADPADPAGKIYKEVTIKVTQDYLTNMNKSTLSDTGGKISLGNQVYYYTEWSYNSNTQEYTFKIDESVNDANLSSSRLNKEATIGASIKYQGVPYYMAQMNEWVRTFSEAFNKILSEGYDLYGNKGTILFTGDRPNVDAITGLDQYLFNGGIGAGKPIVSVNDDSYYKLTAKNFNVLKSLVADPDLLATKEGQTEGVDEYKNVEKLIKMVSDKTQISFRGASAADFLTCILSDIALNANSADMFTSNYTNMGKSIDNQRASISGVDTDEEAVNLVKYQNAYNLASRMIQTMTEVYDRLILQTGV